MRFFLTLAICIIVCNPCFAQVNLTSSLTACYAFNGDATDPISALNGTVNAAGLTSGHNNASNSAYQFSGAATSYIELPASSLLKSTTGVSASCWIKISNFISNDHIIFTRNNAGSQFAAYSLITYHQGGGIYKLRTYKENGTSNFAQSTTTLALNTWYHVVFTIDNTSLKIYVNGVLENTGPSTINFDYQTGKTVILGGTHDPGYNTPFSGAIDNLRFYNRVINSSEVSDLFTNDPVCISPPVASFSVSSSTICAGDSIKFTDLSTNTPTVANWQMTGPSGMNATGSNVTFTFNTPGNYTASLQSSNNGGSSTASTSIVVYAKPVVTASAIQTIICKGSVTMLFASGAASYVWNTSQMGHTVIVSPTANTNYTVYGTDSNGCMGTGTLQVKVSACTSLPQNNSEELSISVYPNPTTGKITLDIFKGEDREYEIYDLLGSLKLKGKTDLPYKNTIDMSSFPNGIYFLKIKNGADPRTIKLVKE